MSDEVLIAMISGSAATVAAFFTFLGTIVIQIKRDTRKTGNGFVEDVFAEFGRVHERLDEQDEKLECVDDKINTLGSHVETVESLTNETREILDFFAGTRGDGTVPDQQVEGQKKLPILREGEHG